MYNESSSPEIYNATLSGNSAAGSGGGMYNYQSGVTLANSILANTLSGGGCASSTGSTLSAAYSTLFEDSANTCGATSSMGSNILGVDPQLAGLADNGGFTPTFALLPGSPAIDRSLANNLCPSSDQRGAGRPQDGDQNGTAYCDLGAYEVGGILYVDQASTCSSDCGSSWATAYPKLQDALASVLSGGQVWVAQGVYYPDEGAGQTDNDVLSIFTVIKGVAVYGGFAGNETALEQRNPRLHPAILSGDLQQDDANSDGNFIDETNYDIRNDNALHVVQISNTDQTTVLDGFVITAGNANGANPAPNAGYGGGVLALNASPVLANLVISGNNATDSGGGVYSGPTPGSQDLLTPAPFLSNSTITGNLAPSGGGMMIDHSTATRLESITFQGNAADFGGGLSVNSSDPVLTNLTFGANTANSNGGGIYFSARGIPTLMNVTLSGNQATGSGGGIYISSGSPAFHNTLIANSPTGGDCVNDGGSGLSGSGNNLIEDSTQACGFANNVNGNIIGTDPQLGPLANNGGSTQTFALLSGSAAIDAGTDLGCPAYDQRGIARPYGSHCDIGAYEKTASLLFLPVMIR